MYACALICTVTAAQDISGFASSFEFGTQPVRAIFLKQRTHEALIATLPHCGPAPADAGTTTTLPPAILVPFDRSGCTRGFTNSLRARLADFVNLARAKAAPLRLTGRTCPAEPERASPIEGGFKSPESDQCKAIEFRDATTGTIHAVLVSPSNAPMSINPSDSRALFSKRSNLALLNAGESPDGATAIRLGSWLLLGLPSALDGAAIHRIQKRFERQPVLAAATLPATSNAPPGPIENLVPLVAAMGLSTKPVRDYESYASEGDGHWDMSLLTPMGLKPGSWSLTAHGKVVTGVNGMHRRGALIANGALVATPAIAPNVASIAFGWRPAMEAGQCVPGFVVRGFGVAVSISRECKVAMRGAEPQAVKIDTGSHEFANNWTHIALVRRANGVATLYISAYPFQSVTAAAARKPDDWTLCTGGVSDLAVWSHAIRGSMVARLRSGLRPKDEGLVGSPSDDYGSRVTEPPTVIP